MDYLTHETQENDRWDLIAYRYYGDPTRYGPILAANPEVRILPRLPAGTTLRIPILARSETRESTNDLPPWKR